MISYAVCFLAGLSLGACFGVLIGGVMAAGKRADSRLTEGDG